MVDSNVRVLEDSVPILQLSRVDGEDEVQYRIVVPVWALDGKLIPIAFEGPAWVSR